MTKRLLKNNSTKRKKNNKFSKKVMRKNKTKKNKYGGVSDEQKEKNLFRRTLLINIEQIKKKESNNKIKQSIAAIIALFSNNNIMINTLIPVTVEGIPVDKEKYKISKTPISDFVSPVTVILNNLSGVISDNNLIRILDTYYLNGGNFNNLSIRFKVTPFEDQLNRKNVNNVKLLLNKDNKFRIIEEGLNDDDKTKLAELLPNQNQGVTPESEIKLQPESELSSELKPEIKLEAEPQKLTLPYPLPDNNEHGYDKTVAPEFWKPIFQNGKELLDIRQKFMEIYENDKYNENIQKKLIICDILERIIPGYSTKYSVNYGEIPKTVVNVGILNCFITILYGLLLYKLFDTKQEFIFMVKGGRAIQLGLTGIPDIMKYVSEDADILIIPNKTQGASYDLNKMENLSCHIGYLVKWMIPEDINVLVSLPSNPKNTNKDIAKLVYNDGKIFKALSDVGFGEISEDIKKYFTDLIYSPIYIDEFNGTSLYVFPNLYDMLAEKLYFYSKYFYLKKKLEDKEPITEKQYVNITIDECNYYMFKFQKAIYKLLEAIANKEYSDTDDFNRKDSERLIMRGILSGFEDYSNEQKENIIASF
jgi:hypothetical protein